MYGCAFRGSLNGERQHLDGCDDWRQRLQGRPAGADDVTEQSPHSELDVLDELYASGGLRRARNEPHELLLLLLLDDVTTDLGVALSVHDGRSVARANYGRYVVEKMNAVSTGGGAAHDLDSTPSVMTGCELQTVPFSIVLILFSRF